MKQNRIVNVSAGKEPADLVLKNARIINVFNGLIEDRDIVIADGYIAGFQDGPAREKKDLNHKFVAPGFIDPHVHIESSMVSVTEFSRAILPFGTTAVVADPHEIANVSGINGIRYMLDSSRNQPVNVFFTLPSCVPATHMETSGASLDVEKLRELIDKKRILALAEMMNFPGVIHNLPTVMGKIDLAKSVGKRVDGHAPGLVGRDLQAYVAAGIRSDHECTTIDEAREKLALGMHIMIREGTSAKNLESLIPLINDKTEQRLMWCTDDRHPHDLMQHGHIDDIVRKAIMYGLDPVIAIRMATLNPAKYFGLSDIGAISPGRKADFIVFDNPAELEIEQVYFHGVPSAENGRICSELHRPESVSIHSSMRIDVESMDFTMHPASSKARVIEIIPDQIVTRQCLMDVHIVDNKADADVSRDMLIIAVAERHKRTGNVGIGFVKGFGLKAGALASSVSHDSHNIIAVGTNSQDIKAAVGAVADLDGGLVAVSDGQIRSQLPLPIAGLMSDQPVAEVRDRLDDLLAASSGLGCALDDPFMTLSFLALPVIPELKITDKGLVDVNRFEIVPVFV
jgi:adenine deaminase